MGSASSMGAAVGAISPPSPDVVTPKLSDQADAAIRFDPGDIAVLHGLVAHAQFNGKYVWVRAYHPRSGKHTVCWGDHTKIIGPENMTLHIALGGPTISSSDSEPPPPPQTCDSRCRGAQLQGLHLQLHLYTFGDI